MNTAMQVVTPPDALLAATDLQDQLKVIDDDLQSALVDEYIAAAVEFIETQTTHCFKPKVYLYCLDRWPYQGVAGWSNSSYPTNGVLQLTRGPLISVQSVKYINTAGVLTTLAPADYIVDAISRPARIWPARFTYWAQTDVVSPNAVQVAFTAGYANDALIPSRAKQAVRFLVAHWYTNRLPLGDIGAFRFDVPKTLTTLIRSLKL